MKTCSASDATDIQVKTDKHLAWTAAQDVAGTSMSMLRVGKGQGKFYNSSIMVLRAE